MTYFFLTFIVSALPALPVGTIIAWKIDRLLKHHDRPFNWRLLFGPWLYLRWLNQPAPSVRDQIAKAAPWDAL